MLTVDDLVNIRLLSADQLVLHDLEPQLLAPAQLVQALEPVELLDQIDIGHRASDVLHCVGTFRSASFP